MYENQANCCSTNIFENLGGVMNIAPTKISGQYKLVVDLNNELWLDNYCGRRKKIDVTNKFIPQVANFLSVGAEIIDSSVLRYGAFQINNKKTFHIPLYLGEKKSYPDYFVLNRIVNENIGIKDLNNIYDYGIIHVLKDLDKLGIHKIFDEIFAEEYYQYPIFFNWDDSYYKIFGCNIDSAGPAMHNINITNNMANQTYFDVFNNGILNNFVKNNLFFPKFINTEFEFEYKNEYNPFNNFYGFFSGKNILEETSDLTLSNGFYAKIKEYRKKIEFTQVPKSATEVELLEFIDEVGTIAVQEVQLQIPQYKFIINRIDIGDYITITDAEGDLAFEMLVEIEDVIQTSLYETVINFCNKANKISGNAFIFRLKELKNNYLITVQNNIGDDNAEDYIITAPKHFAIEDRFNPKDDNYYKFRGITNNDVWILNNQKLVDSVGTLKIDNEYYNIQEYFKFDGSLIVRFDKQPNIKKLTYCAIFDRLTEKLQQFTPTRLLDINSPLKSEIQYNIDSYSTELMNLFGNIDANKQVIQDFAKNIIDSKYQYIEETEYGEITDSSTIKVENYNQEKVLNMMFNSMGHTSYITPNIINIDKNFYLQNGCLNPEKLAEDELKYSWFLIKGRCPNYLLGDIRSLRYFTDKPELTSRLIDINKRYCETVFLGVKYQLPIKYVNYQFAVYIDIDNQKDIDLEYRFEVDHIEKTVYLSINRYLDFSDLIRGGKNANEPLLDLSFFYNVTKSYNEYSEFLYAFRTGGIIFGEDLKVGEFLLYKNQRVDDWKYKLGNTWLIALRRDYLSEIGATNDFTMLFPTEGDAKFYVYSTIEYDGKEYTYISVEITVHGIADLSEDILWCEDISLKFFDTKNIFINRFDADNQVEEILMVDRKNIYDIENAVKNEEEILYQYPNYEKIGTIVLNNQKEKLKLLLFDEEISFKKYYFEINQKITENILGEKTIERNVFRFDEFTGINKEGKPLTDDEILNIFDYHDKDVDESTYRSRISLFNRNQIWLVIKDLFMIDLKFKYFSESQVRMLLNDFMVNKLIDYSELYSINIGQKMIDGNFEKSGEYIKLDVILPDKNIVIWEIQDKNKMVLLNRIKTPYLPCLKLIENVIEFQIPKFKKYNSLFNMFDNYFGGIMDEGLASQTGITATGIWNEVSGNIISTLYCKQNDINISTSFKEEINYFDLLTQSHDFDSLIINNKNEKYISKIDSNINEYILKSYTIFLLDNFYKLEYISNELGQKMDYTIDTKNPYIVYFKKIWEYHANFENLIFTFKRK